MENKMLNGLPVGELFDTLEAIKIDPSLAVFTFRARNRWVSGGENETVISDYYGACQEHSRNEPFRLVNDEPPELLGRDRAPNPVEYVLHAMAGCITTSLVAHAAARGIRIDEVETRFAGDLDVQGLFNLNDKVRNGYQSIRVELRVKGAADDQTLEELAQFARGRSPVFDIVTNGVPVTLDVKAERATDSQAA